MNAITQFTHEQLATAPSMTGLDLPTKDTGPYQLIEADGIPESGSLTASFRANDGTIYYLDDHNANDHTHYTQDEIDTIGNCLIHMNALTHLLNEGKTEEEAEQILSDWWSLESELTMVNGKLVAE